MGDLTVGVYKNPIWRLQFFFFGPNIASDCSPIPWVFKTVLNSKIKLVAATQGGKKSNYPQSADVHFLMWGYKQIFLPTPFFLFRA